MSRNLDAVISRVCRSHCWRKSADGVMISIKEPLDEFKIAAHLAGHKQYGACPISPGTSTCRIALFDLDSHKGETSWEQIKDVAREIKRTAGLLNIRLTAFKSSGGRGIHLFAVWSEPQDAYSVRCAFTNVLARCDYTVGAGGVAAKQIEIFPKQNEIAPDKFGSMFVLPYAGKSELLTPADEAWALSDDVKFIPNPRRKTNGSDDGTNASSVPVQSVSGESQSGPDGGRAGRAGADSGSSGSASGTAGHTDAAGSGQVESSVGDIPAQSELGAASVREQEVGSGSPSSVVGRVPAADDLVGSGADSVGGDSAQRRSVLEEVARRGSSVAGADSGQDIRGADGNQTAPPGTDRTLRLIKSALAAIPDGHPAIEERNTWRDFVFAIHQGTRGSDAGLAIAHQFSGRSRLGKYDRESVDALWAGADTGRDEVVTEQTIFRAVRPYGWWEDQLEDFDVLTPVDAGASGGTPALPQDHGDATVVPQSRYTAWTLGQLRLRPPPSWRVKGVLPDIGVGIAYGDSGSGKSFLYLDMACSIVRGVEWRGNITKQCKVIYLAAEGARGFHWRIEAYERHHKVTDADLADLLVIDRPADMLDMVEVIELTKSIRSHSPVGLIIVDTLAQVTAGADENASKDMGLFMKHCLMISQVTGAFVLVIHHSGKDDSKGHRGASLLKGNSEIMHKVMKDGEVRRLIVEKMKDGSDKVEYPFRLEPVYLDMDEDNEMTSSCVVVPLSAADIPHAGPARGGRRDQNRDMMDRILKTYGELAGLAQNPHGVTYEALIAGTVAKTIKPEAPKRDRRRDTVIAGIQRLVDADELTEAGGFYTQ